MHGFRRRSPPGVKKEWLVLFVSIQNHSKITKGTNIHSIIATTKITKTALSAADSTVIMCNIPVWKEHAPPEEGMWFLLGYRLDPLQQVSTDPHAPKLPYMSKYTTSTVHGLRDCWKCKRDPFCPNPKAPTHSPRVSRPARRPNLPHPLGPTHPGQLAASRKCAASASL